MCVCGRVSTYSLYIYTSLIYLYSCTSTLFPHTKILAIQINPLTNSLQCINYISGPKFKIKIHQRRIKVKGLAMLRATLRASKN